MAESEDLCGPSNEGREAIRGINMTKAKHIITTILAIGLALGLFAACSQLAPDEGITDQVDGLPNQAVGITDQADGLPDLDVGTWAGTGDNPGDGHRYVTMGSYNGHKLVWRVVDVYVSDGTDGNVTGNKTALLLLDDLLRTSDGDIEHRQFDADSGNWARPSDINAFLNGEFYSAAFSAREQEYIVTSRYRMGGSYEVRDGFPSADSSKVFLLSTDEASDPAYFADESDRAVAGYWWLRSPGDFSFNAASVDGGTVYITGDNDNISYGVRPALKINLLSEISTSADYAAVDTAIAAANGLNKNLYANFSEVEAAISSVRYGLSIDEQTTVDDCAANINEAIAALASWSLPDLAIGTWAGHGANPGDGHRTVTMGSYNGHELVWRVLDVYVNDGTDGNEAGSKTALLLLDDLLRTSDGNIELKKFDADSGNWARPSDINAFLNGEFYSAAFSADEQAGIVTTNYRRGGQYEGDYGFPSTNSSKVFLLSAGEASDPAYFADYADRVAAYSWWLRSPGGSYPNAAYVSNVGTVSFNGLIVNYDIGVRPALKISLDSGFEA